MITLTNTARARIEPTVGLLIIAGMALDASTGVVEGIDSIAVVCLLFTGALSTWAT